jgi:hypothetical protein
MASEEIWRWGPITRQNALGAAAITPGDLLEVLTTAGADQGKVRPHATAAGRADPLFADRNVPYGGGLDTAYAAGDSVVTLAPSVGTRICARVASGVAIARGQALESAGNGTLRPVTTGVVVAVADEDELATGDPTPGRLIVRIVAN